MVDVAGAFLLWGSGLAGRAPTNKRRTTVPITKEQSEACLDTVQDLFDVANANPSVEQVAEACANAILASVEAGGITGASDPRLRHLFLLINETAMAAGVFANTGLLEQEYDELVRLYGEIDAIACRANPKFAELIRLIRTHTRQ